MDKAAEWIACEEASRACLAVQIDLKVSHEGHHWMFFDRGRLILNFWPATARACIPLGQTFRCRSWKNAVAIAKKRKAK